ncbi:MAG: PAS domain S-box protein [Candidatus Neomarinimicrobiota bacterium]
MNNQLQILIIDGNASDVQQVREFLQAITTLKCRVVWEKTLASGLEKFAAGKFDLVLLDSILAGESGTVTLKDCIKKMHQCPVIVLSSLDDRAVAYSTVQLGAQDYLIKADLNPDMLERTIRYSIERHRLSAELAGAKERFELLFSIGNDSIFVFSLEENGVPGKFRELNRIPSDEYGYSREEFLALTPFDITAPDEHEKLTASIRRLKNNKTSLFETIHVSRDGYRFAVEINARQFCLGREEMVFWVVRDITDRVASEREMRESEMKYRSVAQSASDAIISASYDGIIVSWNMAANKLFGYSESETLGQRLDLIIPERYRQRHQKAVDRYLKTGRPQLSGRTVELAGLHKYGSEIPIELSLSSWELVGDIYFTSIIRDISERIKATEALQESEEKFRALFEESRDTIFISTPEGWLVDINQAGLDLFGYSRDDVDKVNIQDLYVDKSERREVLTRLNETGFVNEVEVRLKHKTGKIIYCLLTAVLRKLSNGEIQFQGIIHDISNRIQYQQELEFALEKAQMGERVKSLFLANMSHEIRTPLNSILGFSELLGELLDTSANPEVAEFAGIIRHSSDRLLRTVHEILDLSAIEAEAFEVQPEDFELAGLIKTIVDELQPQAQTKQLKLQFSSQSLNSHIKADRHCINEAISNLIDNAIKYTEVGSVKVTLKELSNNLVVEISDTGIGMSPEYLDQMFQAFSQESSGYTKKYQGIGLGLALTKRYLDLNDVELTVDSEKSVGTSFRLVFKQTGQAVVPTVGTVTKRPTPTTAKKTDSKPVVLVVEDDINSRNLLTYFLQSGYQLVFSVAVQPALEIIQSKKVDLILLDLSLDGNDNGLDLLHVLRQSGKYQNLPVIATTAHAFSSDRDNCVAAGCNDYLPKPINQKKLLKKIDALLQSV